MSLFDPLRNFARVAVSTGYDAAATIVVLVSGEGAKLPAPASEGAFTLVWWNVSDYPDPIDDPNREFVRVIGRTSDTLTVTRGQNGTPATVKNLANKSYRAALVLTAEYFERLKQAVEGSIVPAVLVGTDPNGEGSYVRVSIPGITTTGLATAAWGTNDQTDETLDYSPPIGGSPFVSAIGDGYVDVRSNANEVVNRRIIIHVVKWS